MNFFNFQTKIESYYLMALLAACSFAGSFVVIFLPESIDQQFLAQRKGDELNEEAYV